MKEVIKEIIITILMALVIYFLLQFVVQFKPVLGSCMEPTLQTSGQRIIISRVAYWFHDPQRGDIITLHPPVQSSKDFIKRIVGLPGETVEVRQGKVYINGIPLDEPYVKKSFTYSMDPIKIPEGHYFVLGDNRDIASDSHVWGTITRSEIVGKAWITYWPPSKWGLIPHYQFPDVKDTSNSSAENAMGKTAYIP